MRVPEQPHLVTRHWNPGTPQLPPGTDPKSDSCRADLPAPLHPIPPTPTPPSSGSCTSTLYLSRPTLPCGAAPAVPGPCPTGPWAWGLLPKVALGWTPLSPLSPPGFHALAGGWQQQAGPQSPPPTVAEPWAAQQDLPTSHSGGSAASFRQAARPAPEPRPARGEAPELMAALPASADAPRPVPPPLAAGDGPDWLEGKSEDR
ncbi:hypothetical protein J1605_013020 [Eschrichtius robustus]|uniref:Uncharacterized protein n=1 Tax=Eschrichtius robustus TaxID=9764 RepID=A0AB34GIA3_ESCRO|nr:hypothetical protein J1605_013020 [Eschrichtius robustus]